MYGLDNEMSFHIHSPHGLIHRHKNSVEGGGARGLKPPVLRKGLAPSLNILVKAAKIFLIMQ